MPDLNVANIAVRYRFIASVPPYVVVWMCDRIWQPWFGVYRGERSGGLYVSFSFLYVGFLMRVW